MEGTVVADNVVAGTVVVGSVNTAVVVAVEGDNSLQ